MSDNKEFQTFEQYKLVLNEKEKYTDRNFLTNRFYLVFVLALIVILSIFNNVYFGCFITTRGIISFLGMCITVLWWCNVDTYAILISIKFKNVIDVLEAEFPFPVHKFEKEKLDELRNQKKAFVFADTQKLIAVVFFIIFMLIFLLEFLSTISFKKFIDIQKESSATTVSASGSLYHQYYPLNQTYIMKIKQGEEKTKKATK